MHSEEFCRVFGKNLINGDLGKGLEMCVDDSIQWPCLCCRVTSSELYSVPLPSDWSSHLSAFQRLLLAKIIKEEDLLRSVITYISERLGKEFVEPNPWNLDDVFSDTNRGTPIIFVLSPGADPTSALQRFAKGKGWVPGERLHLISMGQGQGNIAEMVIGQAVKSGDWICLQNCHVATSWFGKLERIVEDIISNSQVHPGFRLWLTAMPSEHFPVSVLQNGIKLTTEPPKGIKANLVKAYSDLTAKEFDACPTQPWEWRRLFFAISLFHAVVLQRRKFGSLGWNVSYDFSAGDMDCSLSTVKLYLDKDVKDQIPWTALRYLIGQIHYGGRVTDEWDRRCLLSTLQNYVHPDVLNDSSNSDWHGIYHPPVGDTIDDQRACIAQIAGSETPDVFGLHANAETTLRLQESRKLMHAVCTLQPRLVFTGDGQSGDEDGMMTVINGLLQNLAPRLDKAKCSDGLFDKNESGQRNSLSVVLAREVDRMNGSARAFNRQSPLRSLAAAG